MFNEENNPFNKIDPFEGQEDITINTTLTRKEYTAFVTLFTLGVENASGMAPNQLLRVMSMIMVMDKETIESVAEKFKIVDNLTGMKSDMEKKNADRDAIEQLLKETKK